MKEPVIIAIDGPAGSGKSTVAKAVASRLNFLYIDTGAIYRALTLKVINENIDFKDRKRLVKLSKDLNVKLDNSNGTLRVYLDEVDVTLKIRSMEVTQKVKFVACIKEVRENMVRLQRELAGGSDGAVLEGRDIGTVVFSNARYKFYLDASFDVRVKRRYKELKEKSFNISIEQVIKDVKERDSSDIRRKIAPLRKAEDAILIDTTDMSIDEVVNEILKYIT